MDCPECGTTLATYHLDGREASVCERCGYVGIEAEHRGSDSRVESWTDALRRFYGSGDDTDTLTLPVRRDERGDDDDGPQTESWTDALRRFYGATSETDLVVPVDASQATTQTDADATQTDRTDADATQTDRTDAQTTVTADNGERGAADEGRRPARVSFDAPSALGETTDDALVRTGAGRSAPIEVSFDGRSVVDRRDVAVIEPIASADSAGSDTEC